MSHLNTYVSNTVQMTKILNETTGHVCTEFNVNHGTHDWSPAAKLDAGYGVRCNDLCEPKGFRCY